MSVEEKEKPAKVWQVEALTKDIASISHSITGLSNKQDLMLERQVTQKYVDGKVDEAIKEIGRVEDKLESKYDPYIENAKWLTRAIIIAIVAQIAAAYFQFKG